VNVGLFFRKSSSVKIQPTDADGKYPHLLFSPKRDEPSARTAPEKRYLLSKS
jgi:hypothetical protein